MFPDMRAFVREVNENERHVHAQVASVQHRELGQRR